MSRAKKYSGIDAACVPSIRLAPVDTSSAPIPYYKRKHLGPLAKEFTLPGRSSYVLYAVSLREHPDVVKVGRTSRWNNRRQAYDNWNLAPGDGVLDYRVFTITEEFVDLPKLEAHVLGRIPYPLRHGREWFIASLDDVARVIDQILCEHELSYV